MELSGFTERLTAQHVPLDPPLEHASLLLAHAAAQTRPPEGWLAPLERYVLTCHAAGLSLWAPLHFVVPPLTALCGPDAAAFAELLDRMGALLSGLERRHLDRSRTEQYGLRLAMAALPPESPVALAALSQLLSLSHALMEAGADPGWTLQFLPEPLWRSSHGSLTTFTAATQALQSTLLALNDLGMGAVYPVALGLSWLAAHPAWTLPRWQEWLAQAIQIARAALGSGPAPYGWFEHGLGQWPGSAAWTGEEISLALETSLTLADHRVLSIDALRQAPGLTVPETFSVALKLASEGVDPLWVVSFALHHAEPLRGTQGRALEAANRLADLALELHAQGLPTRNLFEEGFAVLAGMEQERPGFFERGLALAEGMAERGLDPDLTLRFGLPRALRRSPAEAWVPDAVLTFAASLVSRGFSPEDALTYAVPALLSLAQGERAAFETLTGTLLSMMQSLRDVGIPPTQVLFHDVDLLASSGEGTSQAFLTTLNGLLELLQACARAGKDPGVLVSQAMPAAARACKGRTGALAAALQAAKEEIETGTDPADLLRFALPVLVEQSHGDDELFLELLTVVRPRMPLLAEDAGPVLAAALALSEVRASSVAATLDVLIPLLPHAPRIRREMVSALSGLAGIAQTAAELSQLMGAVAQRLPALWAESTRHLWLSSGLHAVRSLLPHQAPAAMALLPRVVAQLSGWRMEEANGVLSLGASAAARHARGEPERFLQNLEAMRCIVGAVASPRSAAHLVPRLLSMLPGPEQLVEVAEVMQRTAGAGSAVHESLLMGLTSLAPLVGRWPAAWERLLSPVIRMHVRQATQLLFALSEVPLRALQREADLDTLREVVTQTGTQAVDVVRHLLVASIRSGSLHDLTAQRESVRGFIRDVGVWDEALFREYERVQSDSGSASGSDAERRAAVRTLRDRFGSLQKAIRSGEVSSADAENPLFGVSLAYVFPSATSVSREVHARLYAQLPDRKADIDRLELPEALRRRPVQLWRSGWQRREGAAVDPALLQPLLGALEQAGNAAEESEASLGWALLLAWADGQIGRAQPKAELLARAARRLPDHEERARFPERAAELLALRELVTDRLRDGVEAALLEARRQDPDRYARTLRAKLAPRPTFRRRFVRGLLSTLEQAREGTLSKEAALARLAPQLEAFDFDAGTQAGALLALTSEAALTAFLEGLGPRAFVLDAGKEVARVHGDWVGQEARTLQTLLFGDGTQRGVLEERPDSQPVRWTFEITKRRAHAPVGLCEGVCTATDRELWNRPDFWQVAFWDEHDRCQGGMHLLRVVEGGRGYLALPGINPSLAAIQEFNPRTWIDLAVEHAQRIAEHLTLTEVWIPAQPHIHSNRAALHLEMARREWPVRRTASHAFSFSPYAYAFSEVLVPPRGAGGAD